RRGGQEDSEAGAEQAQCRQGQGQACEGALSTGNAELNRALRMPHNQTPTKPDTLKLPHVKHASRVPQHLNPEQVARIQQNAYALPQVVKPADFIDEHTPGFEHYLDTLGMIQLQKAAAGARPSRWIAP